MTLTVIKPGLQTTIQGAPFSGHRHLGMPAAGAADCLSLILANHLVGNTPDAIALEITLDDAKFTVDQISSLALTGAASFLRLNGEDMPLHATIEAAPGDEIHIGPAQKGCRSYLALAGDIEAQSLLGGRSTYMGAALGGYHGRALQAGDIIKWKTATPSKQLVRQTPENLIPIQSDQYIIRVMVGPEFADLPIDQQECFFAEKHKVGRRSNRMGLNLTGLSLKSGDKQPMQSAPVFPGTIQCPPDGEPFLLGPDAQTTGGYPRIAQAIRADRHLIGQLRPGADMQFVKVTNDRATAIYRQKLLLLTPWLGAISLW